MKNYGIKLISLSLLSIVTIDVYAADLLAGSGAAIWEVFWDKKLYIPLGIIAVGAYLYPGR